MGVPKLLYGVDFLILIVQARYRTEQIYAYLKVSSWASIELALFKEGKKEEQNSISGNVWFRGKTTSTSTTSITHIDYNGVAIKSWKHN